MKKIVLFIFVAVFGVMTATAQEVDSLQSENLSARVDSLATQLKQLRHDYDYLYCQSRLENIMHQLQIFANNIESKSNCILIYDNHSAFDVSLYRAYKANFEASLENLKSTKESMELLQELVELKILNSNFTDMEINLLRNTSKLLDSYLNAAELSLNVYKGCIDSYLQ